MKKYIANAKMSFCSMVNVVNETAIFVCRQTM